MRRKASLLFALPVLLLPGLAKAASCSVTFTSPSFVVQGYQSGSNCVIDSVPYISGTGEVTATQGLPVTNQTGGSLTVSGVVGGVTSGSSPVTTTTVTTANAYATGYDIGGVITLSSFTPSGVTTGMVNTVIGRFGSAQTPNLLVTFFKAIPNNSGTTITNAAAVTLGATDQANVVGTVSLTNCPQVGGGTFCQATGVGLSISGLSSQTLYAIVQTLGTASLTLASTTDFTLSVTGPVD